MKKAIIFLIFSIFFTFLNAQQLPHYSMYMLNEVIINPAALSKEKNNKATLMLRDQWSSFEGAPSTQSISYSHLNHKKYKRGISIINDVTGPISIINATFSASYSIEVQQNNRISLGASGSIMQYAIDNSQIQLEDDGILDPAFSEATNKAIGNSVAIGAYYYHNDYFIGLAIPNIVGSSLDISSENSSNKLEKHYYINGGINFKINKNVISPSVLLKKTGGLPIQLDMNLKGVYHDLLWGGFSYRTGDAMVAMFGIDYGQSSFGYSYDITTSSMKIPSAGSHGLLFSYKFKSNQRDRDKDGVLDDNDDCYKTPGLKELKGCPDKDKDGIRDIDDECPDEYGLKINNGCPDKDGDGIADKNDKCPDIFGIKLFKGCPDTDGDGLEDADDDCPTEYGYPQNKGCPEGPVKSNDTVYITRTDTVYILINNDRDLMSVFKDVKFESDSYILTKRSKRVLDSVSNYMNTKKELRIRITGHTDSQADFQYNLELSKNRVTSVQKYLKSKGIRKSRIKIDWKGENEPIADNRTVLGREINRRVEIIILNNE
jgi:type IX secretion system PorP/SprF family membrane protein